MKNFRKLISYAMPAVVLSGVLAGCAGNAKIEDTAAAQTTAKSTASAETQPLNNAEDTPAAPSSSDAVFARKGMSMTLDSSGMLSITRRSPKNEPMGEEGSWTVFVYLCGTDLESNHGSASSDIMEMLEASTGENIRFVVETGGAAEWKNEVFDGSVNERYVISEGTYTLVDSVSRASMGDESTLTDFLKWGVQTYPAAKMGLILWNHGGGSISGVCFDETDDNNSISLGELNSALSDVSEIMTDKFEFIGFDACLMGSIECANVLASYARYMYGSEETEPGSGWDYTAIGTYLGSDPDADGRSLGKVVCDSFYESCAALGEEGSATLSCIDLSRIDDVIVSFNTYSKELYEATENGSVLSGVVRNINGAENFGGNNKAEGYTNMVDLAGIVSAGADHTGSADKVLSVINNAVAYKINGDNHKNACGLSAYYPLKLQGSQELKIYGEISLNPYYLSFIDRAIYHISGENGDYSSDAVAELWGAMWSDEQGGAAYDEYSDYCDNYGACEATGESPYIVFRDEPQIFDDGIFGFSLTDESLEYAASVQATVFMPSDDMEGIIALGTIVDISADWEAGIFADNFDGYWFSLPDGQNLEIFVVDECDGYDIYTSPVRINGHETNLRIIHDYTAGAVIIDGAWDGIDENGMASRNVTTLESGDTIIPLYYAVSMESDEEYGYEGSEYVFDGDPEIIFDHLADGDYYYCFTVYDTYGDYIDTDFVMITIRDGDVYYND